MKKILSPHGWLIIDKPLHFTSAQVVSIVKRKFNKIKVGHAGTLDPLATGILPLALGEATKSVQYIMAERKKYRFEVTWGESRTTDDLEGDIINSSNLLPTLSQIESILKDFEGDILQSPPLYSALKIQGRRACDLMRQEKSVSLNTRPVTIYDLKVLSQPSDNQCIFEVECGKGTYVRALARDMGKKLGCFGHASLIDRLSVGPFEKKQALTLEMLASLDENILLKEYVQKVQDVLDDIPAVFISDDHVEDLRKGRTIPVTSPGLGLIQDQLQLCINAQQDAVAFVRVRDDRLCPERVLNI
ncbi:MAG: tRNA pseudouridine(55) synthase TruB [Janthinobacterium lividum]